MASSHLSKNIIYKSLDFLGAIISILSTPRLSMLLKYFRNTTYTHYVARQFKHIGKHPFFEFPAYILGAKYITAGDNLYAFPRVRIEVFDRHLNNLYTPAMVIGDNVWINYDCHIACVNKITIGNNVVIASKVFITDHFHGDISKETLCLPPGLRKVISKGPIIIEDNVLIGEGTAIMPNVRIGKNAIIGTNAVVTRDVKENTVVAGVPAKVVKDFNT